MSKEHMFLAFYRSNSSTATIMDKIITLFTGSIYSHVEAVISDKPYINDYDIHESYGSSSATKGVNIGGHIVDKGKWDYLYIPSVNVRLMKDMFLGVEDAGYDYIGLLGFYLPFRDREDKWFCSEISLSTLRSSINVNTSVGYEMAKKLWKYDSSIVSPGKLYDIMTSINGVKKL